MKYLIILTRDAYEYNLFCSAFRSHLQDGQQNFILKNSLRVGNGNFHSLTKGDVIAGAKVPYFR